MVGNQNAAFEMETHADGHAMKSVGGETGVVMSGGWERSQEVKAAYKQLDREAFVKLLKQEWNADLGKQEVLPRMVPVLSALFTPEELIELLGERAARELQALQHTATIQNLFLERELQRVLRAFHEQGIPLLLFKGPALAYTVYPEPHERTYHDIDALIQPVDLKRAHTLLTDLGFTFYEEYRANVINKKRTGYNYRLKQADSWLETLIELHTAPHPSEIGTAFDVENVWERAERITVLGETVLTMGPVDAFLYLCWHYRFHGFSRLLWLYDLVMVLRAFEGCFDWAELARLARAQRMATGVYYCLRWCQDYFGVPIPPGVLRDLRPPPACRFLLEELILPDQTAALVRPDWQPRRVLAHRVMVDTNRALLLAGVKTFFPEPSILAMRYMEHSRLPLRLYFLFYAVHPWITLVRGIGYLWRRKR